MRFSRLSKFLISVITPQLAGLIGSLATMSKIDGWYATLEKSSLNPPGFVFAPVWTTLYFLMGLAFFFVWTNRKDKFEFRFATFVFGLQLVVNTFWSVAFFGLESPILALAIIAWLWLLIVVNIVLFYRLYKWAGLLLIPYLFWVSFASYLNYMVWILN